MSYHRNLNGTELAGFFKIYSNDFQIIKKRYFQRLNSDNPIEEKNRCVLKVRDITENVLIILEENNLIRKGNSSWKKRFESLYKSLEEFICNDWDNLKAYPDGNSLRNNLYDFRT